MSVFTNPAARSVEQAREYKAGVLNLLGSTDPLTVLRSTPAAMRDAIAAGAAA